MGIEKPERVAANPVMSQKWDEVTEGRDFDAAQAPLVEMLCQWYAVLDSCMEDMDSGGEVRVAYMNDMGDLKQLPQVATMKTASAEIRQLNKQLGIRDEAKPEKPREVSIIHVLHQDRQSRAANRRGAATG